MAASLLRFLDHTRRCNTVGRTPLDEWSARHRDLYLTTHNTCNRQTSMSPGGIWTHDLSRRAAADRVATGTGTAASLLLYNLSRWQDTNILIRFSLLCINQILNTQITYKMHCIAYDYFVHNVLTKLFRLLLRPSAGLCYYYNNTKVQMWLAVLPSLQNNWKFL